MREMKPGGVTRWFTAELAEPFNRSRSMWTDRTARIIINISHNELQIGYGIAN